MGRPPKDRKDLRLIHIWVPQDLHRRMRLRVAELDITMQDWVVEALIAHIRTSKAGEGKKR